MIKLTAIGHLGKDCLVNQVNGKSVMNFNVAVTEKYRQGDEQKDKTTWLECAYWSDRTALAPYLKKGTQVYIEGTPEVRTYPKNDGTTGTSLTVRVGLVQLLGGGQQSAAPVQQPVAAQQQPAAPTSTETLPF